MNEMTIFNKLMSTTYKPAIIQSCFGPTGYECVMRLQLNGNIYRVVGDFTDIKLTLDIFSQAIASSHDHSHISYFGKPVYYKSSIDSTEKWFALVNQWLEEYEHKEPVTVYI